MPQTEAIKQMALSEILLQYPGSESVLDQYGLLLYAKTETARHENLEASALVHGINIDQLIRDLMAQLP